MSGIIPQIFDSSLLQAPPNSISCGFVKFAINERRVNCCSARTFNNITITITLPTHICRWILCAWSIFENHYSDEHIWLGAYNVLAKILGNIAILLVDGITMDSACSSCFSLMPGPRIKMANVGDFYHHSGTAGITLLEL